MKHDKQFLPVRAFALLLGLITLLPGAGLASGRWITFTEENPPENLGFLVNEYTGSVTMTFLGDCTLGCDDTTRRMKVGFIQRIADNGLDFPMRYLSALTATDDLSIANLEGVLTDRELEKVDKKYNFSGPTAYTGILTSGSIECVTLANNHSHDYGDAGYQDTKDALAAAGVAYFGVDCMAVWQSDDGLLIGFTGVSWSLTGDRTKRYARQVALLRELGCAAVVTVMHAGTEYDYEPVNNYQQDIVRKARENGVDLVIGHHPHVVQGYEIRGGMPVLYSLGNCSFGGTTRARDSDALLAQAEMHFDEGALSGMTLRFYPIAITSDDRYNNYSPIFLTGRNARRVITKLEKSTGNGFDTFDEEAGVATVEVALNSGK